MIKSILFRIKKLINRGSFKSDSYYVDNFIHNDEWNGKFPNRDEIQRWIAINGFIQYVKGLNNIGYSDKTLKMLDLGCGRGWLSNLLSKEGNVIGLDPVGEVIEFAKKSYPDLRFIAGTIESSINEINVQEINLIVSSEVIEHFYKDELKSFISHCNYLLCNDGYMIVTTPRKEILEMYSSNYGSPNQPIEEWYFEDEVKSSFVSHGFEVVGLDRVNLPFLTKMSEFPIYQCWLFKKL